MQLGYAKAGGPGFETIAKLHSQAALRGMRKREWRNNCINDSRGTSGVSLAERWLTACIGSAACETDTEHISDAADVRSDVHRTYTARSEGSSAKAKPTAAGPGWMRSCRCSKVSALLRRQRAQQHVQERRRNAEAVVRVSEVVPHVGGPHLRRVLLDEASRNLRSTDLHRTCAAAAPLQAEEVLYL